MAFLGGVEKLHEVLRQADYLAITLSLSDTTRNLIAERELQLMKSTAYLINVARAEIVDEGALYRCVAAKLIAENINRTARGEKPLNCIELRQ